MSGTFQPCNFLPPRGWKTGGILVVGDHASNHVPEEIFLDIDPGLLETHIAWDPGVAAVATRLHHDHDFAAALAGFSRLVVDLNRYADESALVPIASDGIDIPGNHIGDAERAARVERYFKAYHAAVADHVEALQPQLMIALHSYTPSLASDPDIARPWHFGLMYNEDDRVARAAIPLLEQTGLTIGDQKPYTGKLLNATMNRHAEPRGIAYTGLEMRQDMVADAAGCDRYAHIIGETFTKIAESLA